MRLTQQELRVLAHVSQDPVLLDIYKTGKDVHSMTANEMWNMKYPQEAVSYKDFEYARNLYSDYQDKDGVFVEDRFENNDIKALCELGVKYDKVRKMAKTVNFGRLMPK